MKLRDAINQEQLDESGENFKSHLWGAKRYPDAMV